VRYLLVLIGLHLSFFSIAQPQYDWFQYNNEKQTYSIDAHNIHPAAFLKQFSLYSGIEIEYDKHIYSPITYYSKDVKQANVIDFLEKEFSTLLTFKKNTDNQDVLTLISILPKGEFQSSDMVMALDPVEEVILFKQGKTPASTRSVYLTRLEHLERRVRESLERQAERTIKKREDRQQRLANIKKQTVDRKNKQLTQIAELKATDPALYARQKEILLLESHNKE